MTKSEYKSELIKTIVATVIAFIVGALFYKLAFSSIISGAKIIVPMLMSGLIFAGVPSGWKLLPFSVIGSLPVMIAIFVTKLFLSVVIGVVALPINIIKNCIGIKTATE